MTTQIISLVITPDAWASADNQSKLLPGLEFATTQDSVMIARKNDDRDRNYNRHRRRSAQHLNRKIDQHLRNLEDYSDRRSRRRDHRERQDDYYWDNEWRQRQINDDRWYDYREDRDYRYRLEPLQPL